ncbi:MAG: LamG domain-containing protein [Deltaproteobacteria bacterium]|nr:LamG domain-containing protein [Deltaproteobacteria bacterium]
MGELLPRALYEFDIQLLNSQDQIVTRHLDTHYLITDKNLVLWWGMNDLAGFFLEHTKSEFPNYVDPLKEYGFIYHTEASHWLPNFRGLSFDKGNNAAHYRGKQDSPHVSPTAITVELLVRVDKLTNKMKYLYSKNGEFALGIDDIGGNQFKFVGVLGDTSQGCKVGTNGFDDQNANWFEIKSELINFDPMDKHKNWHYVAISYDKNLSKATMYVNGLEKSDPFNKNLNTTCTSIHALNFLHYEGVDGNIGDFLGVISEVALYNKALSAEEIKASCERLAGDAYGYGVDPALIHKCE